MTSQPVSTDPWPTPTLRIAMPDDRDAIGAIVRAAFPEEGTIIVNLIEALLTDATAQPCLSLVATLDKGDRGDQENQDEVVGYALWSAMHIAGHSTVASILAPLAVHPNWHNRGFGGQLLRESLRRLGGAGCELAFVLGDPAYYQRHGFIPATAQGLIATYPPPPEHAEAWMVQALRSGVLGAVRGRVQCAATLDDPLYWSESP